MPDPIIDSHTHVWTDNAARYPEAVARAPYMHRRRYEPADFFAEATPSGVRRAVLVQSDCYRYDSSYLRDCIASSRGSLRGITMTDLASSTIPQTLAQLHHNGFRGVRIQRMDETPHDWLTDRGIALLLAAAGELRMCVCPLVDAGALPVIDTLAEQFPSTDIVIDHIARIGLGNVIREEDVRSLERVARRPRVHVKVSAFYGLGKGKPPFDDLSPLIRRCRDAFGADRLMFGSDCPYQTREHPYAAAVELVRDRLAFLSASERRAILHDTAARLFFDDGR